MNNEDVYFQLRRANPVPSTQLTEQERQRAEDTLQKILSREDLGVDCLGDETQVGTLSPLAPRNRKRPPRAALWSLAASGVAAVLVFSTSIWPSGEQTATAEDLLTTAAHASEHKQKISSPTSNDYVRRVDRLGDTSMTTVSVTDASGTVREDTTVQGTRGEELKALLAHKPTITPSKINGAESTKAFVAAHFGSTPRDYARGALSVLLTPGLSAQRQQEAYSLLAGLNGTEVLSTEKSDAGGEDSVVTLSRLKDGLKFSLVPATGQLVKVQGLIDAAVETTVDAAGIVGCVYVTGVGGPEDLSLACADENYTLNNLTWKGWTSPQATAQGEAWLNTCDPSCAEGEFITLPVTVTATRQKSCGYNLDVYTRVTVSYSEHDKKAHPLAQDETFDFDCG